MCEKHLDIRHIQVVHIERALRIWLGFIGQLYLEVQEYSGCIVRICYVGWNPLIFSLQEPKGEDLALFANACYTWKQGFVWMAGWDSNCNQHCKMQF